jgi:hypothetical protein
MRRAAPVRQGQRVGMNNDPEGGGPGGFGPSQMFWAALP